MAERIEVGDLVMVVRGCDYCGDTTDIGRTFIVRWVGLLRGPTACCGVDDEKDWDGADYDSADDSIGYPICILKKLNPPSIDESTETRTDLTA